ncbi:glycosyltransferase family 4 protein [Actinomyces sp. zg-332]|uniref:glycosyltransferase family 4 protein n=1 Tax=Actinomyces sp. zg-332 TaxID=2708340 RepID=UPI001421FCF3|nr:glycosyltransferase family 4 protein [Actinomyces sp. zg-332]QPK93730.1 glycosyltransferase family 4 protein [Actinomyces sp. zg-332]
MKVLQIVGHTTGGIGSHVKSLSEDLDKVGEQVHILCPEEVAKTFKIKNCTTVWPSLGFSIKKITSFIRAMKTFRHYVALSDIVHVHGNQAAFFVLWACRKTDRYKIVVTLHNKIILSGVKEIVSRFTRSIVAKHANIMSAVSSDLVEEAEKYGAKNTFIAPIFAPRVTQLLGEKDFSLDERHKNFAELVESFSEEDKQYFDVSKPLILSVCRIAPQKAIDDIVRIANTDIDANFVVIGDGDDSILKELKDLDTGNKVFFAGRREDVDVFLRAADVMLLTSKWEGCPLVLQEAMATGLPIISTFGGGIPDLVYDATTDLKGGILCNVGDWQNMGLSLRILLNDTQMWSKYSESGRKIAHTWKDRCDIALFWQKLYWDL